MENFSTTWQFWAGLAAIFAALTAIFAKVGLDGINPDFATFLRTIVIIVFLGVMLYATNQFQSLHTLDQKSLVFLLLSGLATGASWICYFRALKLGDAARVAPVDKMSVVLVALFAAMFLGEQLSSLGWIGVSLITLGAALVAIG
jgi:transporter family protein